MIRKLLPESMGWVIQKSGILKNNLGFRKAIENM